MDNSFNFEIKSFSRSGKLVLSFSKAFIPIGDLANLKKKEYFDEKSNEYKSNLEVLIYPIDG